jgi:hypothetical protein
MVTITQSSVGPGQTLVLGGDGLGEGGGPATVMLVGAMYTYTLGTVKLNRDSFDNKRFMVPGIAAAGTYTVKIMHMGRTAEGQIEIMAGAASSTSGMPGMSSGQSPEAPAVTLNRSDTEWIVSIALVVLTALTALALLWRSRSDLTMIS